MGATLEILIGMKLNHKPPQIPFVRKLCAHLPEKEIEEAEARLLRYVDAYADIARLYIQREKRQRFDKGDDSS